SSNTAPASGIWRRTPGVLWSATRSDTLTSISRTRFKFIALISIRCRRRPVNAQSLPGPSGTDFRAIDQIVARVDIAEHARVVPVEQAHRGRIQDRAGAAVAVECHQLFAPCLAEADRVAALAGVAGGGDGARGG